MPEPAGPGAATAAVEQAVRDALAAVAEEFARGLRRATRDGDLTAAAFSVSRIAGMWSARVRRVLAALLDVAERAARAAAATAGAALPDGWDDLPGRADRDTLPAPVAAWLEQATRRLDAVGERLAVVARQTLADGLAAGDTIDQLRERLLARFTDEESGQLGEGRARRIAATEATTAWHAAALAAARALPEGHRPATKQWVARSDGRTRPAHAAAHGQIVPLDGTFDVAGQAMDHPGDPAAPPALTINCRCELRFEGGERTSSAQIHAGSPQEFSDRRRTDMTTVTAAGGGPYTDAMIALVPTREHAERLAVDDGVPAGELHLTLVQLGPAGDIPPPVRAELAQQLGRIAADHQAQQPGPVDGRGFAINVFNPNSDEPAIVLGVSGDHLPTLHGLVRDAASGVMDLPAQYTPWSPHVTLTYDSDLSRIAAYTDRVGDLTFDRLRLSFAGDTVDIPLTPAREPHPGPGHDCALRTWSTPGDAALAFEDTETGDGRIFAPGSLYWTEGPWPLQYAPAMLSGHNGAELAGAIQHLDRDGGRISGTGVLYPTLDAGAEVVELLDAGAPLGVSVDLDAVNVEIVDRRPAPETQPEEEGEVIMASASFDAMRLLPLADGSYRVWSSRSNSLSAAGNVRHTQVLEWTTGPSGTMPRDLAATLGAPAPRPVTAAVGDPDQPDHGTVVHRESTGDVLMRITRGRVRGATLVAVPAYDRARICLDPAAPDSEPVGQDEVDLAAALTDTARRVIAYVSTAPTPVTARQVATALGLTIVRARGHLVRAAAAGRIRRLSPGRYTGAATLPEQGELSAAMSGNLRLPIETDRGREWDGDAAASRVLAWATDGDGTVDAARLGQAFLYRDADADPATLAAYKLGHADVISGELRIVPRAVFAIAGVLQGAMGGVDVPDDERDELRDRVEDLYDRLADALDDPTIRPPWDDEDEETAAMRTIEASAWNALKEQRPMRAAWFAEPTPEELPPGSGGVHYRDGRVYGWVAQAGEPHAGYPGQNLTIESLGDIDLTHFLRARFTLDDGSTVRVGAFTMNVPHSRDGAECNSAACQFDDTRTVAAIITVGLNERGMWFSGAAAPWLSEWDAQVFLACQPSYHMRQDRTGRWQLRAVLSVPVPGHSSPLTLAASAHQAAAALVQRSNLALAASAHQPTTPEAGTPGPQPEGEGGACPCSSGAAQPATQPEPAAPAPAVDTGALATQLAAALLASDTFVDGMAERTARREEERRAHIEQLRARIQRGTPAHSPDPAPAAVAA